MNTPRLFVVTIVYKPLRPGDRKHLRSAKVVLAPHGPEALRLALADEEADLIEACRVDDQGSDPVASFGSGMIATSAFKAARGENGACWVTDFAPEIPNERFVATAAN